MLSFTRFASFCAILELISAKSATFTLKLDSSASELSGFEPSVHSGGSRIDLDASGSSISGYIDDNGKLIVDGSVMGIGKNYLATASTSSSWMIAQPFSIIDGKLKLYGSDFHAVPNGEDSGYVLGSVNAAATRSDMIAVAIIPEDSDGNAIQSYDASARSSSEEATSTTSPETSITSTSISSTSTVTFVTSSSIAATHSTSTFVSTTSSSQSSSQTSSQAISSSEALQSTSSSKVTSLSSSSSKTTSQSISSLVTALSTSSSNSTTPEVSTFDNGAFRTGASAGMVVALLALL